VPAYLTEGFQALTDRVQANGRSILATLNIVDDATIVGETEVGLSEDAYRELGAEPGAPVRVEPPPRRVDGCLAPQDRRRAARAR